MADAHDSKSCEETRESSTLSPGTDKILYNPVIENSGAPRVERRVGRRESYRVPSV